MDIAISTQHGRVPVTIFQVRENLHLGNAQDLQDKARAAFENGARDLLIDLSQVERITSAGLRAILSTAKLFNGILPETEKASAPTEPSPRSVHVKLSGPSANVRQVLQMAGFDSIMDIYAGAPEAVAAF